MNIRISNRNNKSTSVLFASILAFGLVACSGSSSEEPESNEPDPVVIQPDPPEPEQPVPSDGPVVLQTSGEWSSTSIWPNQTLPTEGAIVQIPQGLTLTVDYEVTQKLKKIEIDGTLDFAANANSKLWVETITSSKTGRLQIGTEQAPIPSGYQVVIEFADFGDIDRTVDSQQVSRGAVLMGATEIWGAAKTSWSELQIAPIAGDQELILSQSPHGWQVGDKLVVAATKVDDPKSDEVVTIASIDHNRVTLVESLNLDHQPFRQDLKVHVANLSRNVIFKSENPEVKRRGHVMFMHNLDVNVHYARFYQLGRTDKSIWLDDFTWSGDNHDREALDGNNIRGRYAVHFHRGGTELTSVAAQVRGSVVEDNPGWAFVNHSSNVDFVDNVSYNVLGGAFQTEAGDERGSFINNIALRTINPTDPLNCKCLDAVIDVRERVQDFSFQGDGFWLHGGMPKVEGNVVSGASGHAFIYWTEGLIETLDGKSGLTKIAPNRFPNNHLLTTSEKIDVWYMPITSFKNNQAYNATKGLEVFYLHAHNNFTVEQQWVTEAYVETLGSTFEDFTAWNLKQYGVGFHYSERVSIKNFRIIGNGDSDKTGLASGHFHNLVSWSFENVEIEGFGLGMDVPTQGDIAIRGGRFDNDTNFRIENPQSAPRNLTFKDIELVARDSQQVNFLLQPDFTLNAKILHNEPRGASPKHGYFFLMPDRITLDFGEFEQEGLYFDQQTPEFIPMRAEHASFAGETLPENVVDKTNQALKDSFDLYFGGAFLPNDARSVTGIVGGQVGNKASAPTHFPPEHY